MLTLMFSLAFVSSLLPIFVVHNFIRRVKGLEYLLESSRKNKEKKTIKISDHSLMYKMYKNLWRQKEFSINNGHRASFHTA